MEKFLKWLNEQIQITLQKYQDAREKHSENEVYYLAKLRTYEEVRDKTEEEN